MLSVARTTVFRSRQSLAFLAMSLVTSSVPSPAGAADTPVEMAVATEVAVEEEALSDRPTSSGPQPVGLRFAEPWVLGQGFGGEVEPNGTTATASPLSDTDGVIRAKVFPNGDVDFYSFTAAAGDRIYVAQMTAFSAGNSTDSQITILGPDGTTVIETDNDNGTFAALSSSIANATLSTAGTYYLRANDFTAGTTSERPYELHYRIQSGAETPTAEVEPNDTAATANVLPANGWVSGARDPATGTEQDWYSFTANAGDTVFLSLDLDPERDLTTWNGRLAVGRFGDAGDQTLFADDAGSVETPGPTLPSEALFVTVKTAGTYYAVVDSASAAIGGPTATYTLSVSVHPAANEGVNCTTYTSTDVPKTIGPANGLVSSVITVPGNPRIADLDVDIVLDHALMNDIDVQLRSPSGNDNGFFSDIGSAAIGGQTQMDIVFDDEAGTPPITTALRGVAIKPELNYRLGWFDGEGAGGTWTLDLRDDTNNASGGTLTSWSLRICEVPAAPPACPVGLTPTIVFTTDFESGPAGFTHTGTADEWELGLPATLATTTANPVASITTCNSGVSCWKTDLDSTYNINSNQDLRSPNIDLTGFSAPVVVTWAQRYQMESANFDHFTVDLRDLPLPGNPVRLFEWLDATMTNNVGNPATNIGASSGWSTFSRRADSLAGLNTELVFHVDSDNTVLFAGPAIDDVTVTACGSPAAADLSITKTDGVTTATAGGSTTYTITASNAGPSNAPGTTVADAFPASLTCTWTCAGAGGGTCTASGSGNINDTVNLPVGGSTTHTASCAISPSATGSLSNTATVAGTGSDPTPGNNSATDTDILGASSDLSITKTDGITTAVPGGSTTYTITASNAGPSNAPGSTVADTFPASLTCTWTCLGAGGGTCTAAGSGNINDTVNLPAGGSTTHTASCTISPGATGSLSNTSTVAAPGGVTDPNPANNSATDIDTLGPSADLSITKTDGITTAVPGGSTTYTITASNAGPSNAPGSTVADTFPASLSCTWTCAGAGGGTCTAGGSGNVNDTVNLPAGGSVTYTAACSISAAATGSVSNTATVAAPGGVTDPNPANNSATDTDTLAGQADMAVTKTVDNPAPTVGSNVTYTVTARNNGPSDAHAVTVTDKLPNGLTFVTSTPSIGGYAGGTGAWTIGTLANGVSATLALVATVDSSQAIVNTASVTAQTEPDPNRSNNSGLVAINAPGLADVQLQETVDDDTPTVGQNVTFTVTARNEGPTGVTGLVVTDNLPSGLTFVSATPTQGAYAPGTGSWTVGAVANGASATLQVVATVTFGTAITRVVSKTQTEPDYASDNDTDSVTLNDNTVADLAMGMVASQEPVPAGATFTYSIVVSNHGPASATNVVVTDTLPAGLTFVSATPTQGTCTAAVSCALGTLLDGRSASIELVVTKTVGGSVSNTASVTATEPDPFMPNNSNGETSTPTELTTFRVE